MNWHGLVRKRAALAAGAALACVALGATALPAAAADGPTTAKNSITHPELDWAGSQIAKHQAAAPGGHTVVTPNVAGTPGLDVSGYQGNVNWASVAANGGRFAYIKATESTSYTNPYFTQQYNGSYNAGLIRGAYHFATPNTSSGAAQADYFLAHGGGWSKDGKTLPGMLDIEWNPYGATCYGLSASAMVNWILSFSNEYHAKTTRWVTIYTATSWWSQCTGNTGDFSSTNPLALANYNGSPGPMPYHWPYQTIWQYADSGIFPGDQDAFNGDFSRVQALANG
ncbi:lysozyme [Actinacidiphila epipremni]|jgi:GH25 family lysozyme M1 (1,4-beta-N-acetylmuramidase)|uniref:Lysozyme n=1 Tax=Actinacidiphila epipremni TaxID=2053013 RepID=A0ABX0ZX04_9ACTN|nr:lysozyme [Actinacidiphila epipremni]NJP46108.1 lysozyme [Actinacidiphila epipremni]